MKKKQIDTLLNINKLVFPFAVFAGFAAICIESISYIGFLKHYVLVDSRFFLILALISAGLLIGQKLSRFDIFIFKINYMILPACTVLYLAMQLLESLHFHNYIFSTYHVQPTNFFYAVFLSSGIFLISKLIKQKPLIFTLSLFKLLTFLVFAAIFMEGTVKTVDAAVFSDVYMLAHLGASYDFKMNERWGVYYDYIKFVKVNTPESASILVPPQQLPWYSTGNVGLDRYFLFPRNMGNGAYDKLTNVNSYDYVMLVWGEWNGASNDAYGWPKETVKAEKVIYFDPASGAVTEKDGNYDPKTSLTNGVWGLIKVKK